MTPSAPPLWTRLEAELRRRAPHDTFEIWLAALRFGGIEDGRIVILAPPDLRVWVQQRFGPALQAAVDAVADGTTLRVDLRDDTGQRPGGAGGAAGGAPLDPVDLPAPLLDEPVRLNPKFTFDQFVIGDGNHLAHAAALAVAELPAQAYNPLFLVGPPGVGKTHLLHAIGNYVAAFGGGMAVRYTTVERFTNEFLSALQARDVTTFKHSYRRNDVLLIDDVQFLESKVKTEEEFFHTFNALHDAGRQLVLTSDRLPRDMARLQERLRERFESGLLVEVGAPDRCTRLTVLRKRVRQDGIELQDHEALDVLADRVTTNVRALEGALIRVVAFASLRDQPITAELADRVLADLYGSAPRALPAHRRPTVDRIQELVAEAFGLTRDELLSPSRAVRVTWPRQVAMYLAREHTRESLPAIGARFGGRDHSTVLHACRRTAKRIVEDPEAGDAVRALIAQLGVGDADRTG